MKEERVNRKDGASEGTDKDLGEQMRARREMEMKTRAKKRKTNSGRKRKGGGRKGGGGLEESRNEEGERERHQGRDGEL